MSWKVTLGILQMSGCSYVSTQIKRSLRIKSSILIIIRIKKRKLTSVTSMLTESEETSVEEQNVQCALFKGLNCVIRF